MWLYEILLQAVYRNRAVPLPKRSSFLLGISSPTQPRQTTTVSFGGCYINGILQHGTFEIGLWTQNNVFQTKDFALVS